MEVNSILERPKIGQVVDASDPENYQRIKVAIPNVTEGVPVEELPWYPCLVTSSNNNSTIVPDLGSFVLVKFPNGDIYNGIVEGFLGSAPQS